MNRRMSRARAAVASVSCLGLVLAGCSSTSTPSGGSSGPSTAPGTTSAASTSAVAPSSSATSSTAPSTATSSSAASSAASAPSTHPSTRAPRTTTAPAPRTTQQVPAAASGRKPVIVLDPGHSPTIHAIDHRTGLNVSDYENEPEMRDMFAVALLVKAQLQRAGYRVVMTKSKATSRVSLAKRAHIANRVHAALAISIHDQAGSNGGIGFTQGNNTVYYQSVGTYRATPSGKRIYFRNKKLAKVSKRYGQVFRAQRRHAQRHHINLQGNVGYNLGSRGLAAGNIWIVQLLSRVPWIYNEAGGNSAGRAGLNRADKRTYARGLVAGVEHCVPLHH